MTLPGWLDPLADAEEARRADSEAIDQLGIPGETLMERAAAGLASAVVESATDGPIVVIAGKGNNGGDGIAAARILRSDGFQVIVALAEPDAGLRGDAASMLERLEGPQPVAFREDLLEGAGCIVDCLLGTGATGSPRGASESVISCVNEAKAAGAVVVACDVPSGVDASTGQASLAIGADRTVTFHLDKVGLHVHPGKEHAGAVSVVDIGIPGVPEGLRHGLISDRVCRGLPVRGATGDKFSAGSVVIAGGSPGLTGAPILAGLGAARGGAGYVTVALPESLLPASDAVPELMGLGVPDAGSSHCLDGIDSVITRSRRAGSLVIGPGLGRSPSAAAFAIGLAEASDLPIVVDADAIHAFGSMREALVARSDATVITPHAGELGGLLGRPREAIEQHRLDSAVEAATTTGSLIVLKGDDTIVATPLGTVAISEGGAPALATAGSGDVLSGLIGALLARGVEPFQACCAAVRLHLEAGRIAAGAGSEGVLSGDVAAALVAARAKLSGAGDRL